ARGGGPLERTVEVTLEGMRSARDELTTAAGDRLDAVSLGTPHYSAAQLEHLSRLAAAHPVHGTVAAYVSTGRDVLAVAEERGWASAIREAGWRIVTDTCTYVTPILDPEARVAMTDSGKWAYYAPGNLGVDVVYGSVGECVRSASAGRVVRDEAIWGG
ncbi:MAG TPA: aconitase X, partial [Actinomycetota bacterium]|nr:aconitase X [Actinomycetota bacterium]